MEVEGNKRGTGQRWRRRGEAQQEEEVITKKSRRIGSLAILPAKVELSFSCPQPWGALNPCEIVIDAARPRANGSLWPAPGMPRAFHPAALPNPPDCLFRARDAIRCASLLHWQILIILRARSLTCLISAQASRIIPPPSRLRCP